MARVETKPTWLETPRVALVKGAKQSTDDEFDIRIERLNSKPATLDNFKLRFSGDRTGNARTNRTILATISCLRRIL